jgi:hypothetical protein
LGNDIISRINFYGADPIEGRSVVRGKHPAGDCFFEAPVEGAGGVSAREQMLRVESMEYSMSIRKSISRYDAVSASVGVRGYSPAPNGVDDSSLTNIEPDLRWRHITMVLNACVDKIDIISSPTRRIRNEYRAFARRDCSGRNAKIEVLDRPTPMRVVPSWRDATSCSYGYQVWNKGVARRSGMCAMSGAPIRRGDTIFRPALYTAIPANASAMILAICIDPPEIEA